jgi:hypothetical protein
MGNDSPPLLLGRFPPPGSALPVPEFASIPSTGILEITLPAS